MCVCVCVFAMTVRTWVRTARIKLLCGELPLTDRQTERQVRHRYTRTAATLTYLQIYSASTLFITTS